MKTNEQLNRLQGEVISIDPKKFTLTVCGNGLMKTFPVDGETTIITVSEPVATLSDLPVGICVDVFYVVTETVSIARHVRPANEAV